MLQFCNKFTVKAKCHDDTFMYAQVNEPGNSSNENQNDRASTNSS